jgi:hypothetical protein
MQPLFLLPILLQLFIAASINPSIKEVGIPLGGNTFQLEGSHQERITAEGIHSWQDQGSVFGVYVKADKESQVKIALELLPMDAVGRMQLSLNGTTHPLSTTVKNGGRVTAGSFTLRKGYNLIRLEPISKDGADFARIASLILQSEQELELHFVRDNIDNRFYWGRRGPSVHLSFPIPDDQDFQWMYHQMTITPGEDPIGSYFMANGFAEGYFGIQVNSESERRILFSVWSPFATDNPADIPEDQKIILLRKGDGVYTGEFGNEGSGGQSYLRYPWKAGVTYGFLTSIRPMGDGNTVYSAWFFDPETDQWNLIASFLRPKTDTWYKRPHCFLENFIPQSGHFMRRVQYGAAWMATPDGNWLELTEARFTGDDIARRSYRMDYAGGFNGQYFFLQNGGFFDKHTVIGSTFTRPAGNRPPKVDISKLP